MEKSDIARVRGVLGEVRAEQVLTELGFRILERNYRITGAEIDLIAEEGRFLVFVEVKLRSRGVSGREAVTPAKQKKICRAALRYMATHGCMNRQARFDVLEIQNGKPVLLRDAFPYQGAGF